MATYAIGDVQGCYDELQDLLEHIQFDPRQDALWFAGDLINRGPQSLAVLRFAKSLPNTITVLGNHEFHLFALAQGKRSESPALKEILKASDRDELLQWLRQRPLLHYDTRLNYAIVHAGILPQWDLAQAQCYARELEAILRSENYRDFLANMYGDEPSVWNEELTGWERMRFITNAFTRMRFCTASGKLDLINHGAPGTQPPGYLPWFEVPGRNTQAIKIIFGHWAVLQGQATVANVFALDTGCVYGGSLTALRLEDARRFSVKSRQS